MEIVYQDKRIVVAVKPVGVLSTDEPGGMPELLRQQLGSECIRTVHRLDAQVSGLMVFARSVKAATLLSEQIQQRRFEKEYLAVIHGTPAKEKDTLRDLLGRDKQRRITYVTQTPGPAIREAVLDYEVLASQEDLSLIKIHLHTGRTHQIRVQFASRSLPLLGDRKYGIASDECPIALWSYRLSFAHPESERQMTFQHFPPETEPWNRFTRAQMLGRSVLHNTAK